VAKIEPFLSTIFRLLLRKFFLLFLITILLSGDKEIYVILMLKISIRLTKIKNKNETLLEDIFIVLKVLP